MTQPSAAELSANYRDKGYAAPIRVLEADEAESYRQRLDQAIAEAGDLAPGILKMKSHLVFRLS